MDQHLYNTVVNLYVKKKMQTKTLNTDVLNNSAPSLATSNGPIALLSPSSPVIADSQQELQSQGHQLQLQTLQPTVSPRSILQSPSSPLLSHKSKCSQGKFSMSLGDYESYVEGDQGDSSKGTGDVTLPGAPSLHTHSSKFPIEREVIVKSSNEKQNKIPNLSDYMRRAKPSIAPDAPPKQLAWTQQIPKNEGENSGIVHEIAAHQVYKAQPMSILDSTKESEPSPIRPANHQDLGPATSTPEADGARGLPQRTYQSLKDMISSRFAKQNGNSGQIQNASNLDASLSPQSQLRQHGVYIGSPQQSQQQPIEMRGMGRSQQQQQRLYEQQQQRGQYPPHQQQQQQQQQQQVVSSSQTQYKYPNLPLPPSTTYQPNQETSSSWKQYNGEGAIPKTQSVDNGMNQPGYANSVSEVGMKNYNQECMYNTPDRYNQSRPPLNHQQQYRGSQRNMSSRPTPANPGGAGLYQAPQNQSEYHPQQNSQYSQGSVIVHASQDGHPHPHLVEDGKAMVSSSKPIDHSHRDGPQGAAALAGPALKDDDDEGGFVKRGTQSDSGRGSTVYSSAKTSAEDTTPPLGEQSEWSERVENELRQILNGPGGSAPPGGGGGHGVGGGGLTSATGPTAGSSESFSSVSPPLPPLSPHSSDDTYRRPRLTGFGSKSGNSSIWAPRTKDKSRSHKHGKSNLLGIEIDSMLEENNSSEDEDYNDTRAIRKQLEGLETMYAQVLKLLGVKQKHGFPRYEASDPRINKRRTCGSVSSVPSSVSSRPIRAIDRRSRAGKVRDVRGINKRFQRLESHVVTLARSVAHLSSEMRTQHMMMQEMEMMRGELAALRVQTNIQQQQNASHQVSMAQHSAMFGGGSGPGAGLNTSKQINSTPDKVKRLTKFFGDEPPLLRLFLRRLGYEKYAGLFEKERIGLLELPFMTEERLHKLGIPLGPRLRIMQQAHLANPNTLCVL